jgi:hypothetical protein
MPGKVFLNGNYVEMLARVESYQVRELINFRVPKTLKDFFLTLRRGY